MFEDAGNEPVPQTVKHLPSLAGDERKLLVFTQLWTQHQSTVRAYLASFLRNSIAVDDALQEVAMVVWQKGPWEGDASAFLGYSLACARRIALAARRKQGDTRMELLPPQVAIALADRVAIQEQEETVAPGERMLALRRCMEKMNPDLRELLESRYSGASKEELRQHSKRVGKSLDTLYKTLERLRELLLNCVKRGQNSIE